MVDEGDENTKVQVSSEMGRAEDRKMGPGDKKPVCTSVSSAWTRFLSFGWGQQRGRRAAQGSEMNKH